MSRQNGFRTARPAGAVLSILTALAVTTRAAEGAGRDWTIDFGRPVGTLRALHGVNNGPVPVTGRDLPDFSAYFRAAAIPLCRLHDCRWAGSPVVDVPLVFPLEHADPADPRNYLFARTDTYLQGIVSAGAGIMYRLGTSIEHSKRKYDVHPPKDFDRWAAVCVNIVRHYNEGWADGFRHGIRYWEVWNEPDLGAAMWSGTPEQYFTLYATVARAIKRHDSSLKVGGPGAAGNKEFLEKFLAYCRDQRVPLDFFSWHVYARDPAAVRDLELSQRRLLDRFGFKQTESHLTEWHYFTAEWGRLGNDQPYRRTKFEEMNGPASAAFNIATLLLLEDTTLTSANYYSGDTLDWGLFDRAGVPRKAYYSFRAFGQFLRTPQRASCAGGDEKQGLAGGAGQSTDGRLAQVLLANLRSAERRHCLRIRGLPWSGGSRVEILAVDAAHDFEPVQEARLTGPDSDLTVDCPAETVLLLRFTREKP